MYRVTPPKTTLEQPSYWNSDGHAVILAALVTLAAFGAAFGGLSYFDVAPLQNQFQWIGWGVCGAAAIYPICVGVSALFNHCFKPVDQPSNADPGAKSVTVSSDVSNQPVAPSEPPNLGGISGYDLIGLILNFLPAGSIPLCSQLSKAWTYLCATNISLKQKRSMAIESLKTIKSTTPLIERNIDRELARMEISKAIAEFDVEHAKKIAFSLENKGTGDARDQALLKIVEVEAANNIQKAKETAKQIKTPVNVIKALATLAKQEVTVNAVEARCTLQTAKEKSQLLQKSELLTALLAIAEADMAIDTEEAKKTLQMAKDIPVLNDFDYLKIVERDLKIDEDLARVTLQRIKDSSLRSQVYGKIGKAEAKRGNIEKAKETLEQGIKVALSNSNPYGRVHSLSSIAKTQFKIGDRDVAKATLQQAKTMSSSITYDNVRAIALAEIAHVESFFDIEQAKATIQSAKALVTHETYTTILRYETKFDLENAKKEALLMTDGFTFKDRSATLCCIVKKEQKVDPAKARQTADLISDPLYKVDALLALIK